MSAAQPRRVGIFGGGFDPPHIAHVALAQAALDQLQLDELRVIPTGDAWHKAHVLTASAHRLAMAKLAFGTLPKVVIDERELHRAGPSYTIDSLREIKAEQPRAELYLVMGADQASALTSWREWPEVLRLATLLIAGRTHGQRTPGTFASEMPAGTRFEVLQLPDMLESATEVRTRLATGKGIAHLVPPPVASYIDQNHLYPTHR